MSIAVHEELTEPRTPENGRNRVFSLSAWFEVCTGARDPHNPVSSVARILCIRSVIRRHSSLAGNDRLGNENVSAPFAFLAMRERTGPFKLGAH
jgi:hypothetical protein